MRTAGAKNKCYAGKHSRYHDGWANLAAAIIASGEQSYDKAFLESEWCETLHDICALDDELHRRNLDGVTAPGLPYYRGYQ